MEIITYDIQVAIFDEFNFNQENIRRAIDTKRKLVQNFTIGE